MTAAPPRWPVMHSDCRMPLGGVLLVTAEGIAAFLDGLPRTCTDSDPCDTHRQESPTP